MGKKEGGPEHEGKKKPRAKLEKGRDVLARIRTLNQFPYIIQLKLLKLLLHSLNPFVATRPEWIKSLCSDVIPGSVMLTPHSTSKDL